MDTKTMIQRIQSAIAKNPGDPGAYQDMLDALHYMIEEDEIMAHELNRWVRGQIVPAMRAVGSTKAMSEFNRLNKRSLLMDAKTDFDAYLQYLEYERDPEKRFYLPRRHVLRPLVSDLQDLEDGKLDFLGISLPPRIGKLVADDTPVLTSSGWKNHGDLTVGDEVVSPNGEFVHVTHVFPKHYADVRVHFSDGTHVDVHENHEWVVFDRHKQRYRVAETREMMSNYTDGHRYFYMLPVKKPMKGEVKRLPVEAYTLGAWLGDGRNTNPDLCIDKKDRAIIERIIADGYAVSWHTVHKDTGAEYYGFRELRRGLQSLGMCHSRRTAPKYIPEMYLTAPIGQRLALLAGLLDTDGTLALKEHRYMFSTTEPLLRDSFISLISTFGWRCSVAEYPPCTSSSGVVGRKTVYNIAFNPTMEIPCQLKRKQLREFSKQRRVSICEIERIEPRPGNCISVEGGVYCVGERLTPTHNSTLCIMFMTMVMGKRPDVANVMSGHSDKLTDGFYREILSILTDTANYAWNEIFPDVKIANTSAKNETIDLNREKRFPTMTCRSIGGTLTGAVEIGNEGILYVDDLIEDLEESLNPQRLQAKYDAYLNQLKDRKKQGARELMVGTRWNVYDPLGRVQEQYRDNPRYRFRVIPALNEDGESNFVYKYDLGFDTKYYVDMRESIDDATWMAKYQGNPYVREGLLFPRDELRYYNGVLPDGEPDKLAVCDVAWGGGDSLSMVFAYVYGSDVYIHDVIFNNGDKETTYPVVIGRTKQHMPFRERFEANNGGDVYADHIDEELRKNGVHISIFSRRAPTTQSKLGRIIQFSPDIKKFYFRGEKYQSKEYRAFMTEVTTFTQTGKNLHDDAPDSLAMLADELYNGLARVEVGKRPW